MFQELTQFTIEDAELITNNKDIIWWYHVGGRKELAGKRGYMLYHIVQEMMMVLYLYVLTSESYACVVFFTSARVL